MRLGDKHQHPAPRTADPDFYSVLLRVIDSTRSDPAYLRSLIYELARSKLYREAFVADMRMSEVRQHLLALESAIDRVEAISQEESIQLGGGLAPTVYNLDEIEPEIDQHSNPLSTRNKTPSLIEEMPQRSLYNLPGSKWFFARPTLQMLGISVLVLTVSIGLYTGVGGRVDLHRNSSSISDVERNFEATRHEAKQEIRNQLQTPPLPTNFGVYAVSEGRLNPLEPLRVKVPDQRVAIGPMITAPSQITLKDGNITFIVYRRDLMSGVPDKVSVRVLARVAHSMTFNGGKPVTNNVENEWVVRGKSYELSVSPIEQSQEMIAVRPESAGFVLPAGRYAIVFKGLAYDFSIGGEITEPAQCIERVEAANGIVYMECRNR
jgi:hypothetical protein